MFIAKLACMFDMSVSRQLQYMPSASAMEPPITYERFFFASDNFNVPRESHSRGQVLDLAVFCVLITLKTVRTAKIWLKLCCDLNLVDVAEWCVVQ